MNDRPPSLAELQHWLKWIITDPRGVQSALSDPPPIDATPPHRYARPAVDGYPWLAPDRDQERVSRMDIYAEAYFARIHESMSVDYPRTRDFLGLDEFMRQVSGYLKHYPSRTPNIGEVGLSFPDWLNSQTFDQQEYVVALASLERNRIYAFYAPFGPPSDFSGLGSLNENEWTSLKLILDPSVFLIQSRFDLSHSEPRISSDLCYMVTYRDHTLSPVSQSVRAHEYFIFDQSQKNVPLLQIIDPLEDLDCDLQELFRVWGNRGVIKTIQWENNK